MGLNKNSRNQLITKKKWFARGQRIGLIHLITGGDGSGVVDNGFLQTNI